MYLCIYVCVCCVTTHTTCYIYMCLNILWHVIRVVTTMCRSFAFYFHLSFIFVFLQYFYHALGQLYVKCAFPVAVIQLRILFPSFLVEKSVILIYMQEFTYCQCLHFQERERENRVFLLIFSVTAADRQTFTHFMHLNIQKEHKHFICFFFFFCTFYAVHSLA